MNSLILLQKYLVIVEVLAAIVGIIHWRKLSAIWRFFVGYLCAVVIIEFFAREIPRQYQNSLYSWTMPVHFLSFFYIYFHKLPAFRASILWGTGIYITAFMIEVVFGQQIAATFLSFNYTIGNIVLLLFILFYFYDIALSDKILYFYQDRAFWFTLGILIYYLASLPYFSLYNYLKINHLNLMIGYRWGVIILDYLMYLCFAFSFWGRKTN